MRIVTFLMMGMFMVCFALSAAADNYVLVNQSDSTLKVQSKAVEVKPPFSGDTAFFNLSAGKSKTVNFGDHRRMMMLHIYNSTNFAENFFYNADSASLQGPNKSWRVIVKDGIKVEMTETKSAR